MMRLYLARGGESRQDISGIIVFVFGRTATYLWGASSDADEARKLNPNQWLHWSAMEWAKSRGCETYDMFGVIFDGHPALTRVLMPDDWDGHPQRKDYPLGGIPVEYHGAEIPPPDQRRAYN